MLYQKCTTDRKEVLPSSELRLTAGENYAAPTDSRETQSVAASNSPALNVEIDPWRLAGFAKLKKRLQKYPARSVAIYGTGNHTRLLLSFLGRNPRIYGLADNDPTKYGRTFLGYAIHDLNAIIDRIEAVVISSDVFQETIYRRIKDLKRKNIAILKIYATTPKAKTPQNGSRFDMQNIGIKARGRRRFKLAHLCFTQNTNAGDTLLFPAVRQLFQKKVGASDFTLIPVHAPVTEATVRLINEQDGSIIGGGGLLLADTNPNSISGWQWPCPAELLAEIKTPLIVFAIGYNRFRNQEDFSGQFTANIQALVEKSAFFSLRNHGGIERLKKYLPEKERSRLKFQPCPTSILAKFYPALPTSRTTSQDRTVAFNIAMDRPKLRFGTDEDEIFAAFDEILNYLRREKWRPRLYHHHCADPEAAAKLTSLKIPLDELNLDGKTPREVIKAYADVSLAIGMRGHAQMIPFGLGTPIYSLISHNKLQYFLDDINHPEWGTDLQSHRLFADLKSFIGNYDEGLLKAQIETAQERLWETTLTNLETIKLLLR